MASSQAADRTRTAPTSEKARTIVEAARDLGPNASNPDVADEVEARIGDRPDPSWVSRVRSKYIDAERGPHATRDGVESQADAVPPEEVILRVDALAGRLDRFTSKVQTIDKDLRELERRIDVIEDAVVDADREELADHFEELSDRLRS